MTSNNRICFGLACGLVVLSTAVSASAQPGPPRPEPEPTEPVATEPKPTESEPTDPELNEPELNEPESTEPEPTQPEPTEPERAPEALTPAAAPLAESVAHAASDPPAAPAAEEGLSIGGGALPKLTVYGFARLDLIYDDSSMNNSQFAFWVDSEDSALGGTRNNGELSIHPRLTRIGLKIDKFELDDQFSLQAKIEIDFQAGGSESRELIRMRHAYGQLNYGIFSMLAGQGSDLISPLFPSANSDGLMWNAGNLGDRRPQLRLTAKPKLGAGQLRFAGAALMPNAVDKQDLDKNGELDGFDAAFPMLQGLAEIKGAYWTEERAFILGVGGHFAVERVNDVDDTDPPDGAFDFNEGRDLRKWSASAHLQLPLIDAVWLAAEAFYGSGLSDVRGGIGQSVRMDTGGTIKSVGGWGELGVAPVKWFSGHAGATIDDPLNGEVSAGQRNRNYTVFAATRFRPWKPFQLALEYIYWVTEYEGAGKGTAHRINLWTAFHF